MHQAPPPPAHRAPRPQPRCQYAAHPGPCADLENIQSLHQLPVGRQLAAQHVGDGPDAHAQAVAQRALADAHLRAVVAKGADLGGGVWGWVGGDGGCCVAVRGWGAFVGGHWGKDCVCAQAAAQPS
jgi:hypothetical protein